ncbi:MAG TPA: histidine phosphatase family protein [Alphaproteobacteria bacterium]|nr:histidine phosphatase family protein [Alphaproteobacteria bacterium]
MKQLLLLRHAKSDRNGGLEDFERPLNARGRKAAPKMAQAMLERSYLPDRALVSPALRTRETWQLMAPLFDELRVDIEFVDRLYLAPANHILSVIRQLTPEVLAPLIVGHNPGIEDLAARLLSEKQTAEGEEALERLKRKFPTCALAVLTFPIDSWSELGFGTGALIEFLTPSSLED